MSGLQQSRMRPLRLLPAAAPVPESLHRYHQPDPKAQISERVRRMAPRERTQHRRSGRGDTRSHEGMYSIKNPHLVWRWWGTGTIPVHCGILPKTFHWRLQNRVEKCRAFWVWPPTLWFLCGGWKICVLLFSTEQFFWRILYKTYRTSTETSSLKYWRQKCSREFFKILVSRKLYSVVLTSEDSHVFSSLEWKYLNCFNAFQFVDDF